MDRDERIKQAAAVWAGSALFGDREGRSPEDALREYDVTEGEVQKYLEELDDYDPTDEPWNSEDTKTLLGWLVVVAVVVVAVGALIVAF